MIPRFQNNPSDNTKLNIGSFGFATNGKGFTNIIEKVQEEFGNAIINLNISFAKFGDENGENAREIVQIAQKKIKKKGINLNISHDHLTTEEILKFLSKNNLMFFSMKIRITGAFPVLLIGQSL